MVESVGEWVYGTKAGMPEKGVGKGLGQIGEWIYGNKAGTPTSQGGSAASETPGAWIYGNKGGMPTS